MAPWAPRRFLRFPFPKIAYPAYKSGRDGSPPTPPKVKLVYVGESWSLPWKGKRASSSLATWIITGRGIYDISALCSENERQAFPFGCFHS
ncbi:hypothetical protein MUK42_35053 [Musa troglodytarum]|uniref:Uncharacterized protein n=1 Tax=Musa troglodytarum TaxID=320322 RepID=A0A9E7KP65_9LILI|nr:hypothetical protein MUK42_35053 [Musa troglodytarum]